MPTHDARQHSAAAERNQQPILEVLQRVLPPHGNALEIASGTGQHVAHFAAGMPEWTWQPSDFDRDALRSIAAWCAQAGVANVRAPLHLDVMAPAWPGVAIVDAIYNANMLHISPWPTCAALMHGAARYLAPEGSLITYGPYFVEGQAPVPSNLAFDADLRARNPAWGVRRLQQVIEVAEAAGLRLHERITMPANNLMLVFKRAGAASA